MTKKAKIYDTMDGYDLQVVAQTPIDEVTQEEKFYSEGVNTLRFGRDEDCVSIMSRMPSLIDRLAR